MAVKPSVEASSAPSFSTNAIAASAQTSTNAGCGDSCDEGFILTPK